MATNSVFQREIAEVRTVELDTVSPIHSAGPVLEMGKWEKNDPFLIMMEDKFQRGAFDVHPHRGLETVTFVIDGSSQGVVSKTLNHVPVTMVEVNMEPGATVSQDLPGSYNGFIYIIKGSGVFGSNKTEAHQGQMMWLGRGNDGELSEIEITATEPLRFVLYAGEPVREQIVVHGPFVMNSDREIVEAFRDLREGTFLKHE